MWIYQRVEIRREHKDPLICDRTQINNEFVVLPRAVTVGMFYEPTFIVIYCLQAVTTKYSLAGF